MAAVESSCAVVLSEQFYSTLYKQQSTRPRMLLTNAWAVLQGSAGLELLHGRVGLGGSPPPPGRAAGGAGAGGGEIEKLVRPVRAVRRDAGAGDSGAGDAEGAREGYCLFPMHDGWGSEGEAARVVTLFLAALSCALASGDAGARIPCAPAPERHSPQPPLTQSHPPTPHSPQPLLTQSHPPTPHSWPSAVLTHTQRAPSSCRRRPGMPSTPAPSHVLQGSR
jgi:hypothetical protein